MKLADETYGQVWQLTIAEGPDVNAEECGHWYSPTAVARMIEEEREACAKVCDDRSKRPFVDEGLITETEWATICGANELAADAIRARSNV